jgi:hypothetical protein
MPGCGNSPISPNYDFVDTAIEIEVERYETGRRIGKNHAHEIDREGPNHSVGGNVVIEREIQRTASQCKTGSAADVDDVVGSSRKESRQQGQGTKEVVNARIVQGQLIFS